MFRAVKILLTCALSLCVNVTPCGLAAEELDNLKVNGERGNVLETNKFKFISPVLMANLVFQC